MGTWLAQAAFALTLARWQSDQSGKADGDAFFSHSFCRGLFSKAVNPERLESSVWGNVMPRPARMNCPVGVAHARRDRECVCLGSPGRIIDFAEGLGTTTHFSFGTVSYSVGQPSPIKSRSAVSGYSILVQCTPSRQARNGRSQHLRKHAVCASLCSDTPNNQSAQYF